MSNCLSVMLLCIKSRNLIFLKTCHTYLLYVKYVIHIFYTMYSVILVFWLFNWIVHMFCETKCMNGFGYITLFFVPRLAWSMYHCRGGLNGEWMQKCNIMSKYMIYLSGWFALPDLVSSWALYQCKAWQTYLYKNDIRKYSLKLAD